MASRKEEKERLRAEREQREREAAAGAQRRRLIGYIAGGVVAVAALVAVLVAVLAGDQGEEQTPGSGPAAPNPAGFPSGQVPPRRVTELDKAVRAAGCTARGSRSEGRDHVETPVRYKSNPPHSGPHNPLPAEDGAYTSAPGTENLVHSLEHGRILIQFKPSAPDELKGSLKALYDEDPSHVILVPNARMPYEVAATAWTQVLGCPRATPGVFDAIRAFKERHRDRAPEYVP